MCFNSRLTGFWATLYTSQNNVDRTKYHSIHMWVMGRQVNTERCNICYLNGFSLAQLIISCTRHEVHTLHDVLGMWLK